MPRYSGAYGNKWSTDAGNFGVVGSSRTRGVSFRPRADRDNIATPPGAKPFLNLFLLQEQENDDYETNNLSTFSGAFIQSESKIIF